MPHACTPILVGVVISVLEIPLLSKTAKFPFRPIWSSENLIDRNLFKKFMQVSVDVTCMYTDFGGCGLLGFRDISIFKNCKFSRSVTFSLFTFVFVCLSLFTTVFVYPCLCLPLPCLPLPLFTSGFVYLCLCLPQPLFTSGFAYLWLCLRLALFTSGLFTSGFVYLWLCLHLGLFTYGFVYI